MQSGSTRQTHAPSTHSSVSAQPQIPPQPSLTSQTPGSHAASHAQSMLAAPGVEMSPQAEAPNIVRAQLPGSR